MMSARLLAQSDSCFEQLWVSVASFPGPRPAFRHLQYVKAHSFVQPKEARNPGNEAGVSDPLGTSFNGSLGPRPKPPQHGSHLRAGVVWVWDRDYSCGGSMY